MRRFLALHTCRSTAPPSCAPAPPLLVGGPNRTVMVPVAAAMLAERIVGVPGTLQVLQGCHKEPAAHAQTKHAAQQRRRRPRAG